MKIKEAERIVVAKPVPSRPTRSTFGSFSELLEGPIHASPPNVCSETAVMAIRPKTVRFKPLVNCAPPNQTELARTAVCNSSDDVSKSDNKPTVIYKPLARLVSKTTVSLLENMGNFDISHQHTQQSVEAQHPSQDKQNFISQISSNSNQVLPPLKEKDQTIESFKEASQNLEDPKYFPPVAGDRPSYDGYNWRKYGQKQVKGSEYPRSYYKCTHPNCPVKKKVERSFDGQIAEIVYKGEHNHPKPQPPKRSSSVTQGLGLGSDGTGQDTNNTVWNTHLSEINEGSDGRVVNQNDLGVLADSTCQAKPLPPFIPVSTGANNTDGGTSDNSCGISGEFDEGRKALEGEDEQPRKRRRSEHQSNGAGLSEDSILEPRIVVQSSTDSEILSDGFRWRKYGQKVVKGNPYPRSYYRCTNPKCKVRKHVERASDDPRAFITTYEGKHNHEMPLRSTTPVTSVQDSLAPTSTDKL
ncbi:hypothetical protein CICLE_v10011660mg [Citrus x clementina]|uniref:WRKY domain-containing protein n=2 Tax=Citrus TaxID=2706 RepID=V4URL8_CITCL|nr:WRKY transcription factor 44 isoform X1 [Citrus x clementina]XP_024038132.1 WRKY transcription factor 44 isoform X1 [Citrus x clementina]XP_024038133.1 WRKY transcription factor 44 isoform X1 [Citrus x clementina]ESR42159.1 hypothetical protein CICLE_v10011660mg [Citrus x clementina]QBG79726.1 WRKY family transcription factor [Citrus limonia]